MPLTSAKSRQPHRLAWSCEQIYHEHVIALGYALDSSTIQTYNFHLQSYLSFCKLHSSHLTHPLIPLVFSSFSWLTISSQSPSHNTFQVWLIHWNLTSQTLGRTDRVHSSLTH